MDKKRKINNSKRKQQVKLQLYFMADVYKLPMVRIAGKTADEQPSVRV